MTSPRITRVTLTCIALFCAACLTALASDGTMVEPASGLEFPLARALPGGGQQLALTGVGIRKKLIFKVYAFGFYVDADAAKERLSRFRGQSSDRLRESNAAYDALMDLGAPRLVVMRFVRNVGAAKMQGALADALDRGVPTSDPARLAFLALWDEQIANGEEVLMLFDGDGTVTVYRHGKVRGSARSSALSRALLESWLGTDPVSRSIKLGAVERVPELL